MLTLPAIDAGEESQSFISIESTWGPLEPRQTQLSLAFSFSLLQIKKKKIRSNTTFSKNFEIFCYKIPIKILEYLTKTLEYLIKILSHSEYLVELL